MANQPHLVGRELLVASADVVFFDDVGSVVTPASIALRLQNLSRCGPCHRADASRRAALSVPRPIAGRKILVVSVDAVVSALHMQAKVFILVAAINISLAQLHKLSVEDCYILDSIQSSRHMLIVNGQYILYQKMWWHLLQWERFSFSE